ncbi:hypothetical protein PLESTM_001502000 [Pleodorina starrii]|nr:hypothetical protein PLESTM_001502000 [Pleodorina starrii]
MSSVVALQSRSAAQAPSRLGGNQVRPPPAPPPPAPRRRRHLRRRAPPPPQPPAPPRRRHLRLTVTRRRHLHLAAAAPAFIAARILHLAVTHCPCLQRLHTEIHQHLPRRQVPSPPPRTRPNTNIFTHV